MKSIKADVIVVVLVSLSLLVLKRAASGVSTQSRVTFHTTANNNTLICHDDFMSVYIPKEQFVSLPSTIFVKDDGRGYHQATAIAKLCRYFLKETRSFIILTVASSGCFVKTQKFGRSLAVAIVAPVENGPPKIIQTINLICKREQTSSNLPQESRQVFCTKNGFNITIPRDATVPPLDLNTVWITYNQNQRCLPQKRSNQAVIFSFSFSECGTQSMITGGNITYWVDIKAKHAQTGVIFRETPFHLNVRCSFALTQMTQLSFRVQQRESDPSLALKSKGTLRTAMRFAKESSYRSFYSSSNPPAVTELGQPVYVEVFVVKHEDEDLVLLLWDCWATPSENPHDPLRWNLLVQGCPFAGDDQGTVVLPVSSKEIPNPSLHKWFVVKMFSFVKSPTSENQIYFHCDIEICKGPRCMQTCSNEKPKLQRILPEMSQNILSSTVSKGPLLYLL
nr:zona pellucida sperm-binding protein 4-like [Nothobranchius furzeri]